MDYFVFYTIFKDGLYFSSDIITVRVNMPVHYNDVLTTVANRLKLTVGTIAITGMIAEAFGEHKAH